MNERDIKKPSIRRASETIKRTPMDDLWLFARDDSPQVEIPEATPEIGLGSGVANGTDHYVKQWQQRLNLYFQMKGLGFHIEVDGEFDSATADATAIFQGQNGLPVTSRVDLQTDTKMLEVLVL